MNPVLPKTDSRNDTAKPVQESKEERLKVPMGNTPAAQVERKSPPAGGQQQPAAQVKEEKEPVPPPSQTFKPERPPEEKTTPLPRPATEKREPPRETGIEMPPVPVMEYNINPRQKDLLEKLKSIKKITRKEYAEMFNVSIPTAARDLKELMDKQLLKAEGPLGPGRWYELV